MAKTIECKKCGHRRDWEDGADKLSCPACGAVYAKVEAAKHRGEAIRTPRDAKAPARADLGKEPTPRPRPSGATAAETKPCPYCAETIHLKAIKCKHCGELLNGRRPEVDPQSAHDKPAAADGAVAVKSESSMSLMGIVITVMVCLWLLGQCSPDEPSGGSASSSDWRTADNSTMAYIMMEDFVEDRLKSPKSAEFPGIFDGRQSHTKKIGPHTYRINSYVDAQNSFGATIRNRFVGEIEQTGENSWRLKSLDIGN